MKYNNHFNPFPYIGVAIYASMVILTTFIWINHLTPKPLPVVEIPHNEVEITFISK